MKGKLDVRSLSNDDVKREIKGKLSEGGRFCQEEVEEKILSHWNPTLEPPTSRGQGRGFRSNPFPPSPYGSLEEVPGDLDRLVSLLTPSHPHPGRSPVTPP